MSFESQELVLSSWPFQVKVRQAMVKAALAIVGESVSLQTVVDAKRHALGIAVLQDVATWEDRFRRAVLAGGIIDELSVDADVEFTVNSVWNDIAGVSGADLI